MWFVFALLSAVFAALTSILAKIGIEGAEKAAVGLGKALRPGQVPGIQSLCQEQADDIGVIVVVALDLIAHEIDQWIRLADRRDPADP